MKILLVLLFVGIASCSPYSSNEDEEAWNHGDSGHTLALQGNNRGHAGNNQGHAGNNRGHAGNNQGHMGNNRGHMGNNQGHMGNNRGHAGNNQGPHRQNQNQYQELHYDVLRICENFVPLPGNKAKAFESCQYAEIPAGRQMPTSSEEEIDF